MRQACAQSSGCAAERAGSAEVDHCVRATQQGGRRAALTYSAIICHARVVHVYGSRVQRSTPRPPCYTRLDLAEFWARMWLPRAVCGGVVSRTLAQPRVRRVLADCLSTDRSARDRASRRAHHGAPALHQRRPRHGPRREGACTVGAHVRMSSPASVTTLQRPPKDFKIWRASSPDLEGAPCRARSTPLERGGACKLHTTRSVDWQALSVTHASPNDKSSSC